MATLDDLTVALNNANIKPPQSLLTLPSEIRQHIYEDVFAPDLTMAQYWYQLESTFAQGQRLGLRLALLAVCKQIHAEAIDVLYKSSVFHFQTFVSDIRIPGHLSIHTLKHTYITEPGQSMAITVENPNRLKRTFVPIEVDYAPLFCYRPPFHIHKIRNIHLLHIMEETTFDYGDTVSKELGVDVLSVCDIAIALYLTIFRDTCPHLQNLTIEYASDKALRNCHRNRSPKTVPYLRETRTLHQNASSLLEKLLPQLRQVRVVIIRD